MASPWGRRRSNVTRHFNVGDKVRVKNECEGSAAKAYVLGKPAVVTHVYENVLASKVAFVWPGDAIPAPQYPMYRIRIAPEFAEQEAEHDIDESCLEPV
jgi:hypothetical protein